MESSRLAREFTTKAQRPKAHFCFSWTCLVVKNIFDFGSGSTGLGGNMFNQVLEFFREGRRRPAPGWFIGLCRIAFGLMWLYGLNWKMPPGFGRETGAGLWHWLQQEIQHPAFPWYRNLLESLVLPNFSFFGWLLFLSELLVGLSLVLGFFTRLFSGVGLLLSLNMLVGLAAHPDQMPVTYIMMSLFHLLFIATNAGLNWGLDQILLEKLANSSLRRTAWGRRLVEFL